MNETAVVFERDRYVFLPSLLTNPTLHRFATYVHKLGEQGLLAKDPDHVIGSSVLYGDFMIDGLLEMLLPQVENASGLALFPTYSYCRVYRSGDSLSKHTDRPSCEVSVSLCLAFDGASPWPLWIEGPNTKTAVAMSPGDALLYRGIECPHWREPLENGLLVQVFLHYVSQNGPYVEWKFDKRGSIDKFALRSQAAPQ